jgi:cyclopropane-fatty-acyl-phospholipid synthase
MAKHYGVRVRAFNISREQVEFARQKAAEENLSSRVEYVLDDYRNISGEHDVFVSVGMLEHVGLDNYEELGRVIHRSMKPEGRGLIHSVGRNRPMKMNAWLERRIFPGAHPPSITEMMRIFENNDLSVLDLENLRLHYAKTLDCWLERFEAHRPEIEADMGEEFIRAWRLYLAGTASSFRIGDLQLFQIVFANSRNNAIPWSRAHQYAVKSESKKAELASA